MTTGDFTEHLRQS